MRQTVKATRPHPGALPEEEVIPDYIIPSVFDRRVVRGIAKAVSHAAIEIGVARRRQKQAVGIQKQ